MRGHVSTSIRACRAAVAIRAALYARVSSDQQAEQHTIDSQVAALLARAAADGHAIQPELRFLDDGQSGASLVRPALERLRDLAAMAAVDVLYVHAPDRLARSYAHQAVLVEEFARAGTEVVFLNRPIGQTPEGTLLLQLQGMFAEYERARIVERSRRGKRHRAQAGAVSVLGRAPYGYRFVSRTAGGGVARFEVVEDEAAVVRRIFQWVAQERVSLAVVCQRLFEAGVPSPTGNTRWKQSMVSVLLTNPAYAGQARFGRFATAPWRPPLRPPRGRGPIPKRPRRRFLAPPEQWIDIPVPALIDAALFADVQAQLAENRRRQRLGGARHLLQGLLVSANPAAMRCAADGGPPCVRPGPATATIAAPGRTAPASMASAAVTLGPCLSSCWTRRSGPRCAGCSTTRRVLPTNTSAACKPCAPGRAGRRPRRSSASWPSCAPASAG
jgi:site-specific DNA recombinase